MYLPPLDLLRQMLLRTRKDIRPPDRLYHVRCPAQTRHVLCSNNTTEACVVEKHRVAWSVDLLGVTYRLQYDWRRANDPVSRTKPINVSNFESGPIDQHIPNQDTCKSSPTWDVIKWHNFPIASLHGRKRKWLPSISWGTTRQCLR